MSDNIRERIARALYEHWVSEQFEEFVSWERLQGKDLWRERADAILTLLSSCIDEEMVEAGAGAYRRAPVGRYDESLPLRPGELVKMHAALAAALGLLAGAGREG
jgi:hypothetical protein